MDLLVGGPGLRRGRTHPDKFMKVMHWISGVFCMPTKKKEN
jgi:hypothetical protein